MELDALVCELRKQTDLFPWSYATEGCCARARVALDLLALSGIPKGAMGMQYVLMPARFRGRGPMHAWDYHVACWVKVNGSRYIIDPSLDPGRALSVKEWINMQKKSPGLAMSIRDGGFIAPGSSGKDLYRNDYECLIFSSGCDSVLSWVDDGGKKFTLKNEPFVVETGVSALAFYRSRIEERLLEKIYCKSLKTNAAIAV